jgi:murein DD-endopeptidase MepM/ murein hydrolase activator NlpD
LRALVLTLVLTGAVGCGPVEQRLGEPGHATLPTRFGLPVADRSAIDGRIGVDHDPVVQEGLAYRAICTDYDGRTFPHCYDEHHGTDLLLRGGFTAMDQGSVEVLAAYDGVVVEAVDGNYDRCHIVQGSVSCDGHRMAANKVVLEHADGVRSMYLHLMKDSVRVEVGDRVACGEPVGRIGSSGNSSLPHLHFEVQVDGFWSDPFAGPWSQSESLWQDQGVGEALPGGGCAARDTGP